MTWWQIVLTAVAIALTGLGTLIARARENRRSHAFTSKYLKTLQNYLGSGAKDMEAYVTLTKESSQVQDELGPFGHISGQMLGFTLTGMSAFSNGLVLFRQFADDGFISSLSIGRERLQSLGNTLQEILFQHLGRLEASISELDKAVDNPVVWLREGVRWYVALPVTVAGWFGLIGTGTARRWRGSWIVSAATFLVAAVGLIASVATIAGEWDKLVRLWAAIFG